MCARMFLVVTMLMAWSLGEGSSSESLRTRSALESLCVSGQGIAVSRFQEVRDYLGEESRTSDELTDVHRAVERAGDKCAVEKSAAADAEMLAALELKIANRTETLLGPAAARAHFKFASRLLEGRISLNAISSMRGVARTSEILGERDAALQAANRQVELARAGLARNILPVSGVIEALKFAAETLERGGNTSSAVELRNEIAKLEQELSKCSGLCESK